MTLSLANHDASLPVAYRLYLPEDWAQDQARRDKAKRCYGASGEGMAPSSR